MSFSHFFVSNHKSCPQSNIQQIRGYNKQGLIQFFTLINLLNLTLDFYLKTKLFSLNTIVAAFYVQKFGLFGPVPSTCKCLLNLNFMHFMFTSMLEYFQALVQVKVELKSFSLKTILRILKSAQLLCGPFHTCLCIDVSPYNTICHLLHSTIERNTLCSKQKNCLQGQ